MGRKPGSDKQASGERKQQIIHLFKRGDSSLEDIGKQIGVSKQYVAQVLDDAGMTAEAYFDVSEIISTIRELSGLSISELARILATDRESVSRWANARKKASLDYARRLELLASSMERVASRSSNL